MSDDAFWAPLLKTPVFDEFGVDVRDRMQAYATIYAQEARRKALQEAATVCDQLDAMSRDPLVCRGSAEECAAAIRSLMEKP